MDDEEPQKPCFDPSTYACNHGPCLFYWHVKRNKIWVSCGCRHEYKAPRHGQNQSPKIGETLNTTILTRNMNETIGFWPASFQLSAKLFPQLLQSIISILGRLTPRFHWFIPDGIASVRRMDPMNLYFCWFHLNCRWFEWVTHPAIKSGWEIPEVNGSCWENHL